MCGICGVVGIKSAQAADAVTRRMMAAMHHRGPDDEGLFANEDVALGMRRLSIIDLAGGQQPVFNEDGSVVVVFNGEIYNFRALRQTLEARGHVFRTRCDTEVIVHAYEEWGTACTHHLRGMFALAVYDRRQMAAGPLSTARGHLFLARDRLGIKPLYYYWGDGCFLFASEVRTLLASSLAPRRLSVPALHSYLLFGSVVEPMTMVEGVFSLPPGHHMLVPIDDRVPARHPQLYWDFAQSAITQPPSESHDRASTADRLRPLLEESIRLHMIADVPLGIFLSSGIDSTALAALASREGAGVHTVTVVFPEQTFSEAEPARRTAQRLGTTHHELMLSSDEMRSRLDDGVAALDQPSMDGINAYFVSWAARQAGLKVALSGLGGDEVFGGYGTFRWTPRLQRLAVLGQLIPAALRSLTASGLSGITPHQRSADASRKLAALWRDPQALPHPYFFTRALFTPAQVSALLNGAQSPKAASPWWAWLVDAARQAEPLDDFTAVSYLELRSYLVNTLLRDTDAMSMAHSLEVRVPFLDHLLLEFIAQLPGPLKQRRGITKALLVEALGNQLPSEVVHQPKRTFTFPWERWLRGTLREQVAAGLADVPPALQPVLNRETVQSIWQDFLAGRTGWSRPWSLYVLNAWARRHL